MPKKTKRGQQKHPDLDPKLNLRSRFELYDQDYIDKLSPEEREWLNKFNREFISSSLDRENPNNNFHNSRALIKDCDDRNNSRNRDILTRAKASKQLADYEELYEEPSLNDYEDHIINELDKKEAKEAIDYLAKELGKDESKLETSFINETTDKEES